MTRRPDRSSARTEIAAIVTPGQPGLPALPTSRPPASGAVAAPAWEPGVVEVEFRDDVAASVALGATAAVAIASAGGVDLSAVHEVLQRHGARRAEPSFRVSADEANNAQASALHQDPAAPNLRNFVTLHFSPDADVRAVAQELNLLPEVQRAVPVPRALPPAIAPAVTSPADEPLVGGGDQVIADPKTGLENQWYLFRCHVNIAWTRSTGDGVVIADIDWGYRTTHQDLTPNLDLSHAHNAADGSTDVSHGNAISHGTAVLGIAGAADNDVGMAGVAPRATLWPIQGNSGPGPQLPGNAWANAIDWVRRADSGGRRKVINLEVQTGAFGNYEQIPSVAAAIRLAIASGVVVCVAAGNGDRHAGIDDQGHPFEETGSILVGAAAYDPVANRRAWFSNYGPSVVVAAPGDSDHDVTCSIEADNAYQNQFGGTSGATPKVAGTVALMLAANPSLSHGEIRDILRATGSLMSTEPGKPVGTFLDADAAVREALRRRGQPSFVPHPPLSRRQPRPEDDGLRRDLRDPGRPQLAASTSLAAFLANLPPAPALSRSERLVLIDQALLLLESFYVHRPLKEAMHAVRPVQRLRLLRYRIEQTPDGALDADLRFHNEMTRIFVSLRDLHTNYLLPAPYRGQIAFLPFYVEAYSEGGSRRYLVSKLVPGFSHSTFVPGVEILRWNGVPMERAVEINADRQAGSNPDARHARGLEGMTIRPLVISLPPDEAWEIVGYRALDGAELELRQAWQVFTPPTGTAPTAAADTEATAVALGLDIQTEAVRQAKQLFFAPRTNPNAGGDGPGPRARNVAPSGLGLDLQTEAVREMKRIAFAPGTLARAARPADGRAAAADPLDTRLPGVFKAREVTTRHGTFGYLRIFTFNVQDADSFVAEAVRLVGLLPQQGLIVDVRGNGGGLIYAGEQLLQIFTPTRIEPERLLFINTPLTLDLCRRHGDSLELAPWIDSIEHSVASGASYSRAFPITPEGRCNDTGQQYVGPVVLVTDALCYSTTDIFAAGFQDHAIGPIIGVHGSTGAGGANVWTHSLLRMLFDGNDSPFTALPRAGEMRVAIRQTIRVGPQAGTLLEDLGVVPEHRHAMTRDDLLHDNVDLIDRAAAVLATRPRYELVLTERSRAANAVELLVGTHGLQRLDFYLDDRPQASLDVSDGEVRFTVTLPGGGHAMLQVRGFTDNRCVAARRLSL
jgi:subtilisin family serine protease